MKTITCEKECCVLKSMPYVNIYEDLDREDSPTYMKYPPFRRTSGAVLYDKEKDKVLIVQAAGWKWGLPKGSIEKNENKYEAAIREVKEETGLDIAVDKNTKYTEIDSKNGKGTYFFVEYNSCPVKVQQEQEYNDANGIGWINMNCLKRMIREDNLETNFQFRMVMKKLLNVNLFRLPKRKMYIT